MCSSGMFGPKGLIFIFKNNESLQNWSEYKDFHSKLLYIALPYFHHKFIFTHSVFTVFKYNFCNSLGILNFVLITSKESSLKETYDPNGTKKFKKISINELY